MPRRALAMRTTARTAVNWLIQAMSGTDRRLAGVGVPGKMHRNRTLRLGASATTGHLLRISGMGPDRTSCREPHHE